MKRIRSLATSCIISFLLSTAAFAGDMPGPGSPEKPPKPNAATAMSGICEPLEQTSEVAAGAACQEATTDLATDAMIIAIQALLSVY